MKYLKLAAILLLSSTISASAQSNIPKAVSETINLAPRAVKGDLQQYLLTYEVSRLRPDGSLISLKTDYLDYSQVCLANTPERGIEYQLTVDSFTIGTSRFPNEAEGVRQVAHQFDGFTVKWLFDRKPDLKNGCYDFQTPLPEAMRFVEGWEFLTHLAYINLWEQARFAVGKQLTRIGDTASFALPGPICISIPDVVKDHRLSLTRQKLQLASVSSYKGRPCAVVKILESLSPTFVDMATMPDSTFVARGTTSVVGEIWISLDKGQIIQAMWKTRTDATFDDQRFKDSPSHAADTYWLRQVN